MSRVIKLKDIASIIRSKNASPFILTIDIFIDDKEIYEYIKRSNIINPREIAEIYKLPIENILGIYYVDQVNAIKISILRDVAADDLESSDIYSAQQYIPLLDLELKILYEQ
jgi:hypothetical protein